MSHRPRQARESSPSSFRRSTRCCWKRTQLCYVCIDVHLSGFLRPGQPRVFSPSVVRWPTTLLEENSAVLYLCFAGPDSPENHFQAHSGGQRDTVGRELHYVICTDVLLSLCFTGPDSPEYHLQADSGASKTLLEESSAMFFVLMFTSLSVSQAQTAQRIIPRLIRGPARLCWKRALLCYLY